MNSSAAGGPFCVRGGFGVKTVCSRRVPSAPASTTRARRGSHATVAGGSAPRTTSSSAGPNPNSFRRNNETDVLVLQYRELVRGGGIQPAGRRSTCAAEPTNSVDSAVGWASRFSALTRTEMGIPIACRSLENGTENP